MKKHLIPLSKQHLAWIQQPRTPQNLSSLVYEIVSSSSVLIYYFVFYRSTVAAQPTQADGEDAETVDQHVAQLFKTPSERYRSLRKPRPDSSAL